MDARYRRMQLAGSNIQGICWFCPIRLCLADLLLPDILRAAFTFFCFVAFNVNPVVMFLNYVSYSNGFGTAVFYAPSTHLWRGLPEIEKRSLPHPLRGGDKRGTIFRTFFHTWRVVVFLDVSYLNGFGRYCATLAVDGRQVLCLKRIKECQLFSRLIEQK